MAFPSWHYPGSLPLSDIWPTQKSQKIRDVVADYGTHCGINLVNDQWIAQKSHGPTQSHLVARYPSLPLAPPVVLPYGFEDPCSALATRTRKHWKQDYIRMKRVIHLMRAKMKRDPYLIESLDAIKRCFDEDLPLDKKPPKWVEGIIFRDSFLRTDLPQAYNTMYNGGLLTHLPLSDSHCAGILVSCDVLTQRRISAGALTVESDRLSLNEQRVTVTRDAVYQLDSTVIGRTGYVAARGEKTCRLFNVNQDGCGAGNQDGGGAGKQDGGKDKQSPLEEMWTLDNGDARPTSVSCSPYVRGEVVSCWDNGQVIIKNQHHCETVLNDRRPRFALPESVPWFCADYGPTPRSLHITDHTAIDLLDIRTGRPKEQELFAIPSKYCMHNELIMTSCSHPANPFYHFVATDYKLFLLDQRMPGYVVLQMHASLRQPPQYLHVLPATSQNGVDHVIVANQSARETLVYPVTCCTSQTAPPIVTDVPWRVAQIEDFIYQCGVDNLNTRPDLRDRFLNSSLLGVTSLHTQTGISVVQLSSTGDLFHQDYSPATSTEDDKTSASGSDRKWLAADDIAGGYCREWLRELERGVDTAVARVPLHERFSVVNATDLYKASSGQFSPHVRCPMCQEEPRTEGGTDETEDEVEMECMQCGLSLDAATRLKQRVQEGRLSSREDVDQLTTELLDVLQPPDTEKYTDPQSRILLKLWNHDYDVSSEIEERFNLLEIEREKLYGTDYHRTDVTSPSEAPTLAATPKKRPKVGDQSDKEDTMECSAQVEVGPSEDLVIESGAESVTLSRSHREDSEHREGPPKHRKYSKHRTRAPKLSTSDLDGTIDKGVEMLEKFDSELESDHLLLPVDPWLESDFDETELEMLQMANTPKSFSFLPGRQ